jgi:molybdopterin converting factor small subunit
MSVQIVVPPMLRHLTESETAVGVECITVGECLDHFVRRYPGARRLLFDKKDKLLSYVEVYVNEETTYPEELAAPVKDGDEISIVYLFSGG